MAPNPIILLMKIGEVVEWELIQAQEGQPFAFNLFLKKVSKKRRDAMQELIDNYFTRYYTIKVRPWSERGKK